MCGIAGCFNLDQSLVSAKILGEMTDSMAHRGPDGRGIFVDGFAGLGHRRLAIIDLSERAAQPMITEDKNFIISMNGEIYNFIQLKKELLREGERFFSDSDTEVVLKLFSRYGNASFKRLNGMFALGIWDKRAGMLTLARDRYGTKPLYYWQNANVFLFASEIKAFLKHPDFSVKPDVETLLEYFTFQNSFRYKSFFAGVHLLAPGHILQLSFKRKLNKQIRQYWDFHFEEDKSRKSENEYVEQLDQLFKQSVNRHLVGDVEVGSYLSGGIDSGSIVAQTPESFHPLKTFCIGFDQSAVSELESSFDERDKARHISDLCHTDHYERVLKSGDMKQCLPDLVWALEDLRLGQSYPNYHASLLASSHVKVCLSGVGGDELFAGYPWRYSASANYKNFDEYIHGYYNYWQRLIPDKTLQSLFDPVKDKVKHVDTKEIFRDVFKNHKLVSKDSDDYINHSLYFDAKTFLHGLLIVEDKLSMNHGLEVRVPFMDNDLVDFALKTPLRLKLGNREPSGLPASQRGACFERRQDGKVILRKVLKKYLGNQIADQYKQGFSGPDASWFKGESIGYVNELLLNKKAHLQHYLCHKTIKSILDEHVSGRENRRLVIWSLLCFEWWLKIFEK